jgi:hypothetical protein
MRLPNRTGLTVRGSSRRLVWSNRAANSKDRQRGVLCCFGIGRTSGSEKQVMGSLKKRRKAKINKHKRRKKLRAHRHKKRTWQK